VIAETDLPVLDELGDRDAGGHLPHRGEVELGADPVGPPVERFA
jgi:hypothetical protein